MLQYDFDDFNTKFDDFSTISNDIKTNFDDVETIFRRVKDNVKTVFDDVHTMCTLAKMHVDAFKKWLLVLKIGSSPFRRLQGVLRACSSVLRVEKWP